MTFAIVLAVGFLAAAGFLVMHNMTLDSNGQVRALYAVICVVIAVVIVLTALAVRFMP